MEKTPFLFIFILSAFLTNTFCPVPWTQAQEFRLPEPGARVSLSPNFNPPILKGIKVHPDNPFQFDFILDAGNSPSFFKEGARGSSEQVAISLIKYFLASITIPENDLWVNLSPYEKDRIIPHSFGQTEMGRDLLAEDYMLKQITASLIYPEGATGRKFWKRIYQEAQKKFGTTNIPVNTFNKVWIIPEKAVVYENPQAGTAYVVESKLKVMLEQDYLSIQKHNIPPLFYKEGVRGSSQDIKTLSALPLACPYDIASIGANITREIVIPELTKEVNENKNFAQLRQIYNSLILAIWYKKKIKDSILEQVYADKNKVSGVEYNSSVKRPNSIDATSSVIASAAKQSQQDLSPEQIYQQYLKAFKKGVFNFIKEEPLFPALGGEGQGGGKIPRKYFSGGCKLNPSAAMVVLQAKVQNKDSSSKFDIKVNFAMSDILEPGPKENRAMNSTFTSVEMPRGDGINIKNGAVFFNAGGNRKFIWKYVRSRSRYHKDFKLMGNLGQTLTAKVDAYEDSKGNVVLRDIFLKVQEGRLALLRGILNFYFYLNPRSYATDKEMENPLLQYLLLKEYGYTPYKRTRVTAEFRFLAPHEIEETGKQYEIYIKSLKLKEQFIDWPGSKDYQIVNQKLPRFKYFKVFIFRPLSLKRVGRARFSEALKVYPAKDWAKNWVMKVEDGVSFVLKGRKYLGIQYSDLRDPQQIGSFLQLVRNMLQTETEHSRENIDDEIDQLHNLSDEKKKNYTIIFEGSEAVAYRVVGINKYDVHSGNARGLYTNRTNRGSGIGMAVFDLSNFFLRERGVKTLFVAVDNTAIARRFHENVLRLQQKAILRPSRYKNDDLENYTLDLGNYNFFPFISKVSNPPAVFQTLIGLARESKAMIGQNANIKNTGGIDLTPARMNLQTRIMDPHFRGKDRGMLSQNDGGIKFYLDPAMLSRLRNAPGFEPDIVSVKPLKDLNSFLDS